MLQVRIPKVGLTFLYVSLLLGAFFLLSAVHAHRADAASPASAAPRLSEWNPSEPVTYVTTAYFLNVRLDSSAKSKIIRVVEKGTLLSVVAKTPNGWLQLEGSGFVHGEYAVPVGRAASSEPAPVPAPAPAAKPKVKTTQLPKAPAAPAKSALAGKYAVAGRSGFSEADIKALFKGTALAGKGLEEAILDVEEEYGVNAYFTIAIMRLESGNGSSSLARNRNNLFGLNSSSGYMRFESKVASVERFGKLIANNYIGKGYTTIEKVGKKYCPANSKWPSLVKGLIDRDVRAV